jgi:predicted transcriptional regulator
MEVHLTPEQEAELSELASRKGRDANTLAQEISALYLKQEARFVEAVKRGIASAERGDFVEHDEVLARIDRLLQP